MDEPTTTTDLYPCQEDEVLTADGVCVNAEEIPADATVVSDWCVAVNGDVDFCDGTWEGMFPAVEIGEALVVERPAPVTELARTGVNSDLALFGVVMIVLGRSLVKWGKRNA